MDKFTILKYGFIFLFGILVAAGIFRGKTRGDRLYLKELESRIEALQEENKRIDEENTILLAEVESLQDSLVVADKMYEDLDKTKKRLINYYEKEIADIDRYTISELDSFFTARYSN